MSMRDSQVHRGPDSEGILIDGNVGLGHRRLSIIDIYVDKSLCLMRMEHLGLFTTERFITSKHSWKDWRNNGG